MVASTNLDDAVEYVFAKLDLMIEFAETAALREVAKKMGAGMDETVSHPRLSIGQMRSMDTGMMEVFFGTGLTPANEAEARRDWWRPARCPVSESPSARFALASDQFGCPRPGKFRQTRTEQRKPRPL